MRPFRFGVGASQLATDLERWPEHARRIENLGYSVLTVGDHPSMRAAGPLTAVAAAALATTTLRVGTYVLANDFHHPVRLAREIATLDQLSGGRIELGLGAGWLETDYETYGAPFDPPSVRIARLAEALQIISMFFAGEPFVFDGDHYNVDVSHAFPTPYQSPRPPLVVGGGSRSILSVAARFADVVALTNSLAGGSKDLHDPSLASGTWEATMSKLNIVREEAGPRFESIELGALVQRVVVTDDIDETAAQIAVTVQATPEQVLNSPNFLIGDVARIVDRLQEQRDATGISYLTVVSANADAFAPVVSALAGR